MKQEYRIPLNGEIHIVIVSDEKEALQAAKAAGRAIIGVENGTMLPGVPYVAPSFEAVDEELAEQVLRRHLGLPWIIAGTERLRIREFVKEDAKKIPEEEYGDREEVFRSEELLAQYISNQYRFYEYGIWAVERRETGELVGMAGVRNPELPERAEALLKEETGGDPRPWLELGYHIFGPFRRCGYGEEAAKAVTQYAEETLDARLFAVIEKENKASRRVAESLGWVALTGSDSQACEEPLLYGAFSR
jgi:RimJ/RimL family protein N-acetyltransferase